MVLRGLAFSSCQAWLTGIYFVKKPWGTPILPTGFLWHPYILYALILSVVNYSLWFDLQMKVTANRSGLSLTEQILVNAVSFISVTFDIYFRFSMYCLNKKLGQLLVSFEEPKMKPLNSKLSTVWSFHRVSLRVLTFVRYLPVVTKIWYFAVSTQSFPDSEFVLPRVWYFIVLTLFAAVPHVTTLIFSYDLIVETTFQFLWTFEDFCSHLEDYIRYSDGSNTQKQDINASTFIEKFDYINSLALNYDLVIGPIILGVIVRCVFSVTHSVTAIVLNTGDSLNLQTWYHVVQFLVEVSQFVILKLGSEVQQRITFWKQRLTKACLISLTKTYHPRTSSPIESETSFNDTGHSENIHLKSVPSHLNQVYDLVKCICSWEWKISAFGIFYVDKTLLCGILSTTMSYVIILFQLNLGDTNEKPAIGNFHRLQCNSSN